MKTVLITLFVFLMAGNAFAQHEAHQHKDHLEVLVSEYLEIKNALVKDDLETAKNHLKAFADEVSENSEMNQHEEHAKKHEMHHAAMVKAVEMASEAEDIDSLRAAFKNISAELIKAVENQGYDEKLFIQFCPMKAAGQWLSKEEKIQNPYLGTAMPSCGNVEKVIE